MLESLEVLNGELTPKFDKYNNLYTVQIGNDVFSLELNYQVTSSANVSIFGNENLQEGENEVIITVMDDTNKMTEYNLLVMKEEAKTTSNTLITPEPLEVRKELPGYVAPLIAIICFTLILITFGLLFRKRKHKN